MGLRLLTVHSSFPMVKIHTAVRLLVLQFHVTCALIAYGVSHHRQSRLSTSSLHYRNTPPSSHGVVTARGVAGDTNKVATVTALASASASNVNVDVDVKKIKRDLFRLASVSGRGAWSRPRESSLAKELVSRLETVSSADAGAGFVPRGCWELILSDVEAFRASVFFLALASNVEANIAEGASDGALTVHSMATGAGEVGRVAYIIEENNDDNGNSGVLHSLVELGSVGSLPSLPLSLRGTVVSSGTFVPSPFPSTDDNENSNNNDCSSSLEFADWELSLVNTTVRGNEVRYGLPTSEGLQPFQNSNLLSWIGRQNVPSGSIFQRVLGESLRNVRIRSTYVDDELWVFRTPELDNHFFCFVRGQNEDWPEFVANHPNDDDDEATTSPIGSLFALGMLNPFFSRRAAATISKKSSS